MKNFVDMYLDWVNNFLSLEAFAEHYAISVDLAELVIKEGRILHKIQCGDFDLLSEEEQNYFDSKMSW